MANKDEKKTIWENPRHVTNRQARDVSEALLRGSLLRQKVADGWALGTFLIELPSPEAVTSIALAGFDFVVLDMEHSATDFSRLETLILAAHAAGLVALVRIWGEDTSLIGKVLDMGANGIMVPHVCSAAAAKEVVERARFAPYGGRGFSPITKYDSLQTPLEDLGKSVFVVVQVEGQGALSKVDEISAVSGVDAVFVGPYDLALSMGVAPGSPDVFAAAEKLRLAADSDASLGIYIDDPETCSQWADRGFRLQCVSYDGRMMSLGARMIAEAAQESMKK